MKIYYFAFLYYNVVSVSRQKRMVNFSCDFPNDFFLFGQTVSVFFPAFSSVYFCNARGRSYIPIYNTLFTIYNFHNGRRAQYTVPADLYNIVMVIYWDRPRRMSDKHWPAVKTTRDGFFCFCFRRATTQTSRR